jgi:hypothetical protein
VSSCVAALIIEDLGRGETSVCDGWVALVLGGLIQHGPAAVTVGIFLLPGGLIQKSGASGFRGFVSAVAANLVIALQLLLQRIYWRRSLRLDIEAGQECAA